MKELRFTLLADGASDRALIPILKWTLQECGVRPPIVPYFADYTTWRSKKPNLSKKIEYALFAFPCDLLFIHRDAENQPVLNRQNEINEAVGQVKSITGTLPPFVPVIPIRMTEAWLIIDEIAIRRASGNPNGRVALKFPKLKDLESHADPKATLYNLLCEASELSGRRRDSFQSKEHAPRVSELLEDYSPLRQLSAFQTLVSVLKKVVREQGWNQTQS